MLIFYADSQFVAEAVLGGYVAQAVLDCCVSQASLDFTAWNKKIFFLIR